jgi:hypothetical protein
MTEKMTTIGKTADPQEPKNLSIPQGGKLDPLLGRIDLIAILAAVLGVCLLGVAGLVMAIIGLARLISTVWADSFDRWLVIILGLALIWVAARWKRLCVF